MTVTDVVIVGAGPIGLELAVALKRQGVDYLHLDAGQVGQTISWYPHQVRFFSSPQRIAIAGVPLQTVDQAKASREEYLAYLRTIVQMFDLKVRTYERVTSLQRRDDHLVLHTSKAGQEHTYHARRVVLAIGDMHSPRKLGIPGEDLPHVSHYFDEPHRYFQQKLLIVGGRNSAVEAALRCHRAGADVSVSYRRAQFDPQAIKYWLLPEIKSLTKHGHVRFHPLTVPRRITPTHVTLTRLEGSPGSDGHAGDTFDVQADFVLILTGYVMDTQLLEQAGVDLIGPECAPKLDPQTMQTNVPGLYVAGTAAGGTQQQFRLFIENCHVHVDRIAAALTGRHPAMDLSDKTFQMPEA